jgi:hypothetical protein
MHCFYAQVLDNRELNEITKIRSFKAPSLLNPNLAGIIDRAGRKLEC